MSSGSGTGTPVTTTIFSVQFRIDFPEFAHTSPETFTDESINFWYGIGDKLLSAAIWDAIDIRTYGLELFVAHNVILAYNEQQAILSGDMSGGKTPGLITGTGVGDVNLNYDIQSIVEEGGGEYNTTIYGRKLLRLVKTIAIAAQV
jgi:hypothetical protein